MLCSRHGLEEFTVDILLPALLNVAALIFCALAIWVGQNNHKAPPLPRRNPLPGQALANELNNSRAFRAVDRIPFVRRSGQSTVNDLAKVLFLMLAVSFLPTLPGASPVIALWASAILLWLVAFFLFMHPFLIGRQRVGDNLRGRSPFRKE